MRRIAIVGMGGAGKSTLSRRLGAALGLPVVHLDTHYWNPGWIETPDDEWDRVQPGLFEGDAWVADGNPPIATASRTERSIRTGPRRSRVAVTHDLQTRSVL